MKVWTKIGWVAFALMLVLFGHVVAMADDPLDDFPVPLGGRWGTLHLTESTAAAVAETVDGYIVAGRQNGPVGPALDYWSAFARLNPATGMVEAGRIFDTESDHNEAFDLIPSYDGTGTLDGYVIAGARHQAYTFGAQEYYLPDVWLLKTDAAFEKQWEATGFGHPFTDHGYSLVADGGGYIIGGLGRNGASPGNSHGYLLRVAAAGDASWEMHVDDGAGNYISPVIHSVARAGDGGLAVATENGMYKLDADTPPAVQWSSGSDDLRSVIVVADGYVATGSAMVAGDPDHTDLVLVKLNPDGSQAWRRTFGRSTPTRGATGLDDWGASLIQTADGGFAVTGTTRSYAWHGGADMWVLKTDASGLPEWDVVLGDAGNDFGRDILQGSDGALVAAGSAYWEGTDRMYIVKLDGGYQPPTAAFTFSPVSPFFIETPIRFDAGGSADPDGDIIRYEWDFGDGHTAEGPTPEHIYIAPGEYTVTLYVTDDDGVRREARRTVVAEPLEIQWERKYGDGRDWGYDMIETPDGGFLVSGINCNTGVWCDWRVMKLDSRGDLLWQRVYPDSHRYNDSARKAVVAPDGNYVVAGFRDKAETGETRDMRVLKISADQGDILWEQFFDLGSYDDAFDLKRVSGGGYILIGSGAAEFGGSFIDARLVRIDETGAELWSQSYSNSGDLPLQGHAGTPTADGGYVVVCGRYSSHSADPIVVIKTDGDGVEQWRRELSQSRGKGAGEWVRQTPDGGYLIAGTFEGQYALIKLRVDGVPDWEQTWGTEYDDDFIDDGDVTPDGGYVLAGAELVVREGGSGDYDLYIARTDDLGNLAWQRTLGEANSEETGQAVVYQEDGGVVVLAGDSTGGGTWLLKMGSNLIPTGDFTFAPTVAVAGSPVTFTAEATDPDGRIDHFVWRFGAGQGDPMSTGEAGIVHNYAVPGDYRVSMTVVDERGGKLLVTHPITVIGDGTDLCPGDPDKVLPGICGCGTPDDDSDGDGAADCIDACPLDSADDADGDGVCADADGCPADGGKIAPGICGCGVADVDTDGDALFDCEDACPLDPSNDEDGDGICGHDDACPLDAGNDADGDGLCANQEMGPDGGDAGYDGNGDGVADNTQENVASLFTADLSTYVTLSSPAGTRIRAVSAEGNPSPADSPDVDFPYGFFHFTVTGVVPGGATALSIHLPPGETVDEYYKYGPTPSEPTPHWYEFLFDGATGAEIAGNVITLHFVDGARGDDDLNAANGEVVDIGGPGIAVAVQQPAGSTAGGNGGGGGGGCFVSTVTGHGPAR